MRISNAMAIAFAITLKPNAHTHTHLLFRMLEMFDVSVSYQSSHQHHVFLSSPQKPFSFIGASFDARSTLDRYTPVYFVALIAFNRVQNEKRDEKCM